MEYLGIYHYPCLDGFTAAWILNQVKLDGPMALHPATYGAEPPDVTDKTVYMVDFSYKRPVMEELICKADKIIHLDHHQSSLDDLYGLDTGLPRYQQIFDSGRSGAGLAWDYFALGRPRPPLVSYVEDRDIWAWKLPNSRDINAAIGSYEMTFENWDFLGGLSNTMLYPLVAQGRAINRQIDRWIKELSEVNTKYMVIGGWKVPVLNVPYFLSSEAGHYLAEKDLERKWKVPRFSATYSDGPMDRKFSLRSIESGMDVAKIAELYGGGGHKHAAGFRREPGWEGDNK